ncbi:MAG: preprotein translocase subunit YajC, partial [Spirochaetes bacterium]
VAGVKDNTVILKVADNVKVEVNRSAISQIVMSKAGKAQQETKPNKPKEEKEEKEVKEIKKDKKD